MTRKDALTKVAEIHKKNVFINKPHTVEHEAAYVEGFDAAVLLLLPVVELYAEENEIGKGHPLAILDAKLTDVRGTE